MISSLMAKSSAILCRLLCLFHLDVDRYFLDLSIVRRGELQVLIDSAKCYISLKRSGATRGSGAQGRQAQTLDARGAQPNRVRRERLRNIGDGRLERVRVLCRRRHDYVSLHAPSLNLPSRILADPDNSSDANSGYAHGYDEHRCRQDRVQYWC